MGKMIDAAEGYDKLATTLTPTDPRRSPYEGRNRQQALVADSKNRMDMVTRMSDPNH